MWWVMGLVAAVSALPVALRLRRRRAERLRIDRIRDAVDCWLSALKQPDGTPALESPDRGQALPRQPVSSGPRIRVALGDPSLSATLAPGWRFR